MGGAKVMQGQHDSKDLVVVHTFSLVRLSRGQPPPAPLPISTRSRVGKIKNGDRGRLEARRGLIPVRM